MNGPGTQKNDTSQIQLIIVIIVFRQCRQDIQATISSSSEKRERIEIMRYHGNKCHLTCRLREFTTSTRRFKSEDQEPRINCISHQLA